jgi:hypothetical protein
MDLFHATRPHTLNAACNVPAEIDLLDSDLGSNGVAAIGVYDGPEPPKMAECGAPADVREGHGRQRRHFDAIDGSRRDARSRHFHSA